MTSPGPLTLLLGVADLATSMRFYQEALGFIFADKQEDNGQLLSATLRFGETKIVLEQQWYGAGDVKGLGISFYFQHGNVGALYESLVAKGFKPSKPSVTRKGNKRINITDPDGFWLCFEHPTDETPTEYE